MNIPAFKKFKPSEDNLVDIHTVINTGIHTFRMIVCKLQCMWGMNIIEPTGNEEDDEEEKEEKRFGTTVIDKNTILADEIMGGSGLSNALEICYKSLVFLGDLHRHWFMLDVVNNNLFNEARSFYFKARMVKPDDGYTFNQLGALESYVDNPLQTICFYAIGDASVTPNKLSKTNITGELSKFAKRKVKSKTISQPRERFVTAFLQLFSLLFKGTKKSADPTPSKISRTVTDVLSALEAVVIRLNSVSDPNAFKFLAEAVILETYICTSSSSSSSGTTINVKEETQRNTDAARDLLYSSISRIVCSGVSYPPASIALEVTHIFLMWFIGSGTNDNGYFDASNFPERNLWTSTWDSISNLLNCLLAKKDSAYVNEKNVMCAEEALLCGAVPYSKVAKEQKNSWKGHINVLYDDCPELYSLRKKRLLELGRRVTELGLDKSVQALYWCENEMRFSHFCLKTQPQSQMSPSPSLLSSQSCSPSSSSSSASSSQSTQEMTPQKKCNIVNTNIKGFVKKETKIEKSSCCFSQSLFLLSSQSQTSETDDNENSYKIKNEDLKTKPFSWLTKEWIK